MTPVPMGAVAPDFTLRDQHGQDVTLSSYRGKQAVVVLFFPFAFSRVCTGELVGLRDALGDVDPERAAVLAVSCDPVYSLRAFADAQDLPFPLLSDFWPHGVVATSYGVLDEERGCAGRSTFVVDLDGVVRWSVHSAMPEPRDLTAQLDALARVAGPPDARR